MKKIYAILAFMALSLFFGVSSVRAADVDTEEQNFVNLLNDFRKSKGLSELKITKPLLNGADYFSEYFANNADDANANIHIDSKYGGPEERGSHYGFYFATENIGWGYETGQEIFNAWKASSGHYDNMTNKTLRTIGISRFYKADGTKDGQECKWFWLADFSDEGVDRLRGNNLKKSELYYPVAKKMTITIKKKNKNGKYKKAKNAEVRVYNKSTGKLIDFDIANKKGVATLYTQQDLSKVKVKLSKFKGKKSIKFTTGKKKVKSKKVTWKSKGLKYTFKY